MGMAMVDRGTPALASTSVAAVATPVAEAVNGCIVMVVVVASLAQSTAIH